MQSGKQYAFVDESNRSVTQTFDSIESAFNYLPESEVEMRATIMEIRTKRYLNEEESAIWMRLWMTRINSEKKTHHKLCPTDGKRFDGRFFT